MVNKNPFLRRGQNNFSFTCYLWKNNRTITILQHKGLKVNIIMLKKTKEEKLIDNLLEAIHENCLSCCCSEREEIRLCPSKNCPLYKWRFGTRGVRLPKKVKRRSKGH